MIFRLSHEIVFVHDVRRAITSAAVDDDMRGKRQHHAPALFLIFYAAAPDAIRDEKGDSLAGFEIFEHALQYSIRRRCQVFFFALETANVIRAEITPVSIMAPAAKAVRHPFVQVIFIGFDILESLHCGRRGDGQGVFHVLKYTIWRVCQTVFYHLAASFLPSARRFF